MRKEKRARPSCGVTSFISGSNLENYGMRLWIAFKSELSNDSSRVYLSPIGALLTATNTLSTKELVKTHFSYKCIVHFAFILILFHCWKLTQNRTDLKSEIELS